MSNNTTGNPWILDTAATILTAGEPITITKMLWHPAATDDDLTVTDGNGNVQWTVRAMAAAANNEVYGICEFVGPKEMDGFILSEIEGDAGGTLYVHFVRDR